MTLQTLGHIINKYLVKLTIPSAFTKIGGIFGNIHLNQEKNIINLVISNLVTNI